MEVSRSNKRHAPEPFDLQVFIIDEIEHCQHVSWVFGRQVQIVKIHSSRSVEWVIVVINNHNNIIHDLHVVDSFGLGLEGAADEGLG